MKSVGDFLVGLIEYKKTAYLEFREHPKNMHFTQKKTGLSYIHSPNVTLLKNTYYLSLVEIAQKSNNFFLLSNFEF